MTLDKDVLDALVQAQHADPFAVLGPHLIEQDGKKMVAIRAFVPGAQNMFVRPTAGGSPVPMQMLHADGFFEAVFPRRKKIFPYRLITEDHDGNRHEFEDPYRFLPVLSDFDLHLFGEGNFFRLYEKFGAHVMEIDGVSGVHFAVWAPNATRVSLIGTCNGWDGRRYPMRLHPGVGVWEIFIPGLDEGEIYKYELRTRDGHLRIKADPLAFRSELRPATASIVHSTDHFTWNDSEWLENRKNYDVTSAPLAIYEVHPGSWRRVPHEDNRPLTYRELAHELADYVKSMGYTHVELMPITEHPFDGSWGYQTTGYFAPTSRYGTPDDFKYFVDYMHKNGIGVILDWVPAHFPKDDFALRRFDGTALYEHEDPRQGEHPDWGTLIFNYGRNEVRNFLISNALFWFDEYHIDGLRVDAVASMLYLDYSREEGQWIPNKYGGRENLDAIEFLKKLNETVYEAHPDILMIAEESTSWPAVSRPVYLGGLGFGLKWNMGWMNDFLEYIEYDPIHRKYHQNLLTFGLLYAFTENFVLVLSHDEVVHGKKALLDKMPGDLWQKFANLRAAYGFMYGHPGKKLLFMGGEFGQWQEWQHDQSLDWHLLEFKEHQGLQHYVRDLNQLYRTTPALWQKDFSGEGFQWIDFQDAENSIISFIRRGHDPEDFVVVVCNFTPVPRFNYKIGVPAAGHYAELLNSDSEYYAGGNIGNFGGVDSSEDPAHGFPHSIRIAIPPLATVFFKKT